MSLGQMLLPAQARDQNEGYLAPLDEANERREKDTKFTKTQNWDSPAHFSGGGLPG
jgi:hypothetical protein